MFKRSRARVAESSPIPDVQTLLNTDVDARENDGALLASAPESAKTIPPDNTNRTLVLCFDGTGDQFNADNSNIVELFSMLKKDDPNKQLVYYQSGIGTYTTPDVATPLGFKLRKTLDKLLAWNLDSLIIGGYEFLMQNYRIKDKICIFGFSRGAYIARCLAGMLHKVGLLPAYNHQQVPFAYKMYTRADSEGWKMSNTFKRTYSIDVDIEFLGVFDCVSSVGLLSRRLPFTTSSIAIRTFRHALALDERRAKFRPSHWNRPTSEELNLSETDKKKRVLLQKLFPETNSAPDTRGKAKLDRRNVDPTRKELQQAIARTLDTDVEEVWFAGCHYDVGGGSVRDGTKPCLARIPLRWMIREIFKAKTGMIFEVDGFKRIGMNPDQLYPEVFPRPPGLPTADTRIQDIPKKGPPPSSYQVNGTEDLEHGVASDKLEEEAELKDVLAPMYDPLKIQKMWWVLEFLPLELRYQRDNDEWVSHFKSDAVHFFVGRDEAHPKASSSNLGRARFIPKQQTNGFKVHRSVKTRMGAEYEDEVKRRKGKRYIPKSRFRVEPVWVD